MVLTDLAFIQCFVLGTACSGGSGQSGTVPTSHADEDSDSETSHPAAQSQERERTRQKKFIKYFKDLPEEICTVREFLRAPCIIGSLFAPVVLRDLLCSGGGHPSPGTSLRHPQLYWVPF